MSDVVLDLVFTILVMVSDWLKEYLVREAWMVQIAHLATGHAQLLSYPFPTVTSSDNSSLLPKFAHLHFGSIRVKWYGLLIRTVDGTDLMSVPRPIFAQLHQASSIDEPDHVLGRPNFARSIRTV
ncbi:hypothetical protein YC2023_045249 [Brassica napus]